MDRCENLFRDLPEALPDEVTDVLLRGAGSFRLERIVSQGQASPPDFWYDQEEHEWVLLVEGAAGLRFEDEADVRELAPGDHLLIRAHRRHRVEFTPAGKPTVWLALFWKVKERYAGSGCESLRLVGTLGGDLSGHLPE